MRASGIERRSGSGERSVVASDTRVNRNFLAAGAPPESQRCRRTPCERSRSDRWLVGRYLGWGGVGARLFGFVGGLAQALFFLLLLLGEFSLTLFKRII